MHYLDEAPVPSPRSVNAGAGHELTGTQSRVGCLSARVVGEIEHFSDLLFCREYWGSVALISEQVEGQCGPLAIAAATEEICRGS
jgi:hypothetical protein